MEFGGLSRWVVRHTYVTRAIFMSLAVILMLLTITIPFFNNARSMTGVIADKKKESQDLANRVSVLSGLDGSVLDERVRILDTALPPRKDVVLYLSAIEGLSRELNLNFGSISLSPGEVTDASPSASAAKTATVAEGPGLHTLETDIEITGTQDNIYSFLRLIEESAPLMQIKDVKVTGVSSQSYSLGLRLGMLYALTDVKEVKGSISLFDDKEEAYFQDLAKFRSFPVLSDLYSQDTDLGKSDLFESVIPQQ